MIATGPHWFLFFPKAWGTGDGVQAAGPDKGTQGGTDGVLHREAFTLLLLCRDAALVPLCTAVVCWFLMPLEAQEMKAELCCQ